MIFEKKCRCCGKVKPVTEFRPREGSSDGYRGECKVCKSEIDRQYKLKNSEECKRRDADYYNRNKDVISKKHKDYYELNKEHISLRVKQYAEANKEHLVRAQREWREKNKARCQAVQRKNYLDNRELVLARVKDYYESNKEKIAEYLKEYCAKNANVLKGKKAAYRRANKGRISALRRKYEERLKRATPNWLTSEDVSEMEDMYTAAQMFKEYTGIDYEIDHVVPLQGKTVCGLNVPWNLGILEMAVNRSKGNRYWPDMPDPE